MPNSTLPIYLPVSPRARPDIPRQLIAVDVFTVSHDLPAAHIVLISRHDAQKLYLSLGAAIRGFDAQQAEAAVIKLPRRRKRG